MKVFTLFFIIAVLTGCGVKGRPLPPKTPREIGIGKPIYKGVDQEMKEDESNKKPKAPK